MMRNIKDINVLILCGGLGKRLKAVAPCVPKPMVKIGNRPFLDLIIDHLAKIGFRHFILGLGYKADIIKDYYSGRKFPGLEISFSCENKPLDTGGAVKHAKPFIKSDPFLVLNGDSLNEFDAGKFLSFHKKKNAAVSILIKKASELKEYGKIEVDAENRIVKFNEKNLRAKSGLVNAGIYIFAKKAIELMPARRRFSLEYDFFPAIAGKDVFGFISPGFFIDIGTPKRLSMAEQILLKKGRLQ